MQCHRQDVNVAQADVSASLACGVIHNSFDRGVDVAHEARRGKFEKTRGEYVGKLRLRDLAFVRIQHVSHR